MQDFAVPTLEAQCLRSRTSAVLHRFPVGMLTSLWANYLVEAMKVYSAAGLLILESHLVHENGTMKIEHDFGIFAK
jgi:hypothetical protein